MNDRRKDYIDIYRGIGILFMVVGHVYIGYAFDKFSHAFHMPMFFFVSGYFFSIKGKREFFCNKLKTLLIPYFVFGSINIFLYSRIKNLNPVDMFGHLFWINTEGLYDVGAIWFLTALFFAISIYSLLRKITNAPSTLFILVNIISIVGYLMSTYCVYQLPWALEASFVAIGFIYVGNIVRKYEKNQILKTILNIRFYFLVPLIFIDSLLIYVNGYVNMRTGDYANFFLFFINACLSIIILWNVAKLLSASRCNIIKCVCKRLQYIGRNSIIFLCLNQIIICVLTKTLPNFNIYIKKAIVFFITMAVLSLLNEIFIRSKLKVIIGR